MTGKKDLSVCLVTYNDEKHIADCLAALKSCADEIIVADIGSKDQTVALARRAGAQVDPFKWTESFSEVRNFCMAQAAGRWVLFLQAYERISAVDLQKLPQLLKNPNAEGYLLEYAGVAGFKMDSPNGRLRLIRNRADYRFQYRAFEQLPDEQMGAVAHAPVKIRRCENTPWDAPMRLRLLEQDAAAHPQAHYIHYMQGLCLFNAGAYAESLPFFERACDGLHPDYLFAAHAHQCRSWCLLHQKRYPAALVVLEKAVEAFPHHTDFLVLRGEAHWQLGTYSAAIRDLKRCLNALRQPACIVDSEISTDVIWASLGAMMARLANVRQALACFQQAYYLSSRNPALFADLCALALEADEAQALSGMLGLTLKQNIPAQLLEAAQAFLALGRPEQALALTERVAQAELPDRKLAIEFAAHLKLGNTPRAPTGAKAEHTASGRPLLGLIKCRWLCEDLSGAQALIEELEQAQNAAPPVKAACRLMQTLFEGNACPEINLTAAMREEIAGTHDLLLMNGQTGKAKTLLPLLLKGARAENLTAFAMVLWARCDDFEAIRHILAAAQDAAQAMLKQRIFGRLLHDGHLMTAERLLPVGGAPTQEMVLALWSACGRSQLAAISRLAHGANGQQARPEAPAESLAQFRDAVLVRVEIANDPKALARGDMHAQIGAAFESLHKAPEAAAAYLRALQWGPNALAQEKLSAFWQSDPDMLAALLKNLPWPAESGLFQERTAFSDHVHGLVCLGGGQLKQAYAWFEKAAAKAPDSPAVAYMLTARWLRRQEEGTDAPFGGDEAPPLVWAWCFALLKAEILRRLAQGQAQSPDDGLLLAERERVLAFNLPEAVA